MIQPLDNIRVVDLTKLAPGPHCTMILGDLGAEVVKIEEPGPPTGRRAEQAGGAGSQLRLPSGVGASPYNALGRNKRSIALNLKDPMGREVLLKLAARCDVLVEEFRPGVARRLGIDYDTLSRLNPRLVYCSITGYGQNAPYRDLVGHDLNYIGTAGALSILGRRGEPPTIPHNLLADYAGGGMHAAIGVLAALLARERTGAGQYVDIAMLDGTLLVMAQALCTYFATRRPPRRGETMLDGGSPFYNIYLTKDEKYLTIAAIEPWFYANLCRALGREDLVADQYNRDKYETMQAELAAIFRTRTRDEWFQFFGASDVAVGRMLTLDELEQDPQIAARNMIVELETPAGERVKQVGLSIKLSKTPGSIRRLAPALGEHTDAILEELGYTNADIARMRAGAAIR